MKRSDSHPESGRILVPSSGLRALIVDDETLARQGIRMLLAQDAEIGVVEEAGNGKRAAELMLTGSFDLIFLDVQMHEMDGFAALRRAGAELRGAVIFVTAYDQYAVEAFEVNAADYLLKPFTPRRFRQALQRAKARIHNGSPGADARVLAVWERLASQPTYLNRIAVRSTGGTSFVDTKDVDWAMAAENYVELHVGRDCYLVEVTMAEIAKRLDPARFVRIHRSVIVNVGRIRQGPVRIPFGISGDSCVRRSSSLRPNLQEDVATVDFESVLQSPGSIAGLRLWH
jgi:two-component system LytT family response regulator